MSTKLASLATISSPKFLQGEAEASVPKAHFAVAIPRAIAASISQSAGSILTSPPGRIAVSSLSGIGWIASGTIHRIMWAARLLFSGVKTERAVQEVAMSVDVIGQKELQAKETLRDAILEPTSRVASYIPGGSLAVGGARVVDALAKRTERWGLFGLRTLVTSLWGYTKYVVGGEWFRWGERKVEQIKRSCYENMFHPSALGEELLLFGDKQNSTARKLLRQPQLRPPVSPCSEEEFARFLHYPADAKRIILERIITSKTWSLTSDEASAFKVVLEKWIENEKALLPQNEESKKVLFNLYSIYLAITPFSFTPRITRKEFEEFKQLLPDDQRDRLFLLSFFQNNATVISSYLQALRKDMKDLSEKDTDVLFPLLGKFSPHVQALEEEIITPSEFSNLPRHVQYRIFKLVGRKGALTPSEQTLFIEKAPNSSSWQTTSREDKELLSHLALFHFNRLPRDQQRSVYNLSFDEVRKLPPDHLACFLWEILAKLPPPTVTEKMGVIFGGVLNPDDAIEKKQDLDLIKTIFDGGIQKLLDNMQLLKKFIRIVNKRLSLEQKILLRDALDSPLALYFLTEDELRSMIAKYRTDSRSLSLPEDQRETALKTLKVLEKAYEWQIAEALERAERSASLGLKEGESLPPKNAHLPETPLDKINQVIGAHIVSSGGWYKTLDIMGAILEKTIAFSGQTIGQVPRGIGLLLDSTAGSTAVYGGIRSLAIALQICSQFPLLMNQLAQSLKVTVSGKEYSWIEHVERPAAAIPLIPLKLTIPLQNTLLGGMESIKARIDSLNQTIASLRESRQKLEQTGSPDHVRSSITQEQQEVASTSSQIKEAAASNPVLSPLAEVNDQVIQNIFSSSKTHQEAILKLRNAAIPQTTADIFAVAPQEKTLSFDPLGLHPFGSSGGTDPILYSLPPVAPPPKGRVNLEPMPEIISNPHVAFSHSTYTEPVLSVPSMRQKVKPVRAPISNLRQDLSRTIEASPILNDLTKNLFEKTSHLGSLYQDLQIALSAQKTIEEASSFQRIFSQHGGQAMSSLYTTAISPILASALALWKTEVKCATAVVNSIVALESFETKAAYDLFNGINHAGVIAQDTTEQAMKWISSHIGDLLLAEQSEIDKAASRKMFDTALGYVAGFGSRSFVTLMLGSLFGYYTPVILLPFLLSRTIPDLLNASAEGVARNLGKTVFLNGYRGIAWASNRGGFCTHQGMTSLGRFVQRAMNRRHGYVDEQRVRAFLSLEKAEQQYVLELIKESTQINESTKKEIENISGAFFHDSSPLEPIAKQAFVEAILLAYDHLQPQDFVKVTPAYFYRLDKRIQFRITQAVKRKFPNIPFQNVDEIIAKFNTLPRNERKSINSVTKEEFSLLPPESQKELCFHVLHSAAYKNWYEREGLELTFETLFEHIDPKESSIPGTVLNEILFLYQDVGDGELADISPAKLASSSLSRILRLYEIFETSHHELLTGIAYASEVEIEAIRSILETEHPVDPATGETRNRLLTAMASAYRSLPEYSRREFFNLSPLEIHSMSREEKKIALEYIIQKNPDKKNLLQPLYADMDLKEPKNAHSFMELFNVLDAEDKASFHQTTSLHQTTFSFLTRSLVEELKEVDSRLLRGVQEKEEAEKRMVGYSELLDALKTTGVDTEGKRRIEAIAAQLRKAGTLKNLKDRELAYLLSVRSELEKLLLEEHITIAPCPIKKTVQPNPLAKAVCELMIKAIREEFLSAPSIRELDEKYATSHKDLSSMVEKLEQDQTLDTQGKEFLVALKEMFGTLKSAYEDQKHRINGTSLTLPAHLEIIVRGTKERFAQIFDVTTLRRSHEEALSLAKEIAALLPESTSLQIDMARAGIETAYERRLHELEPKLMGSTRSRWDTVRGLLPGILAQGKANTAES